MGKRGILLSLALGLCLGTALAVPTDRPAPVNADAERIGKLIEQLGNGRFAVREAATKELDAIGEAALPALKKAATSTDREVAQRATALVEKISKRGENARLSAPTVVELSFKDTPVPEAVAELSKKSGYPIVLGGDVAKLNDRKVTLETGKVPFWTALRMLCDAADLMEADGINNAFPRPDGPPTGPRGGPVPVPVPLPAVPPRPIKVPPVLPANPGPALPAKPIQIKPIQIEKVPPQQFNFGFAVDAAEAPKAPPVPPQPAQQIQVQVQQVQPVQIQIQIGGAPGPAINPAMPVRGGPMMPGQGAPIVLVDGKAKQLPTHVEGAVRIRAMPPANAAMFGPPAPDQIAVVLQAQPEPKLTWQNVVGVKVDKATDDQGQSLSAAMIADNGGGGPGGPAIQVFPGRGGIAIAKPLPFPQPQPFFGGGGNYYPIRLKKGDKESKALKELTGVLTVNVRTAPEALVAVENVMKAKANAVKAPKADAALKVMEVKKTDNGDYQVQVEVSYSNEVQPAMPNQFGPVNGPIGGPLPPQINGRIQIQIAPAVPAKPVPPVAPNAGPNAVPPAPPVVWNPLGLELTDGKDKPFQLAGLQFQQQQFNGRGMTSVATLTFRPADKEQGEPAKLTFKGTRLVTVDVPFALKDVPLK